MRSTSDAHPMESHGSDAQSRTSMIRCGFIGVWCCFITYETVPLCFEILGPRYAHPRRLLLRRCCKADAVFTFLMNDLIEGHHSTVRNLVGCRSFCFSLGTCMFWQNPATLFSHAQARTRCWLLPNFQPDALKNLALPLPLKYRHLWSTACTAWPI